MFHHEALELADGPFYGILLHVSEVISGLITGMAFGPQLYRMVFSSDVNIGLQPHLNIKVFNKLRIVHQLVVTFRDYNPINYRYIYIYITFLSHSEIGQDCSPTVRDSELGPFLEPQHLS